MDRELYNSPWSNGYDSGLLFPAPREVDRYLYYRNLAQFGSALAFPAPREVDRGLYSVFILLFWPNVSGPSRGE